MSSQLSQVVTGHVTSSTTGKTLKDAKLKATLAAINLGFSSLQEPVRLFLKELSTGNLRVKFEPKAVQLSPKAIKRYDKMTKDFETEKNIFTANSVDELMDHLTETPLSSTTLAHTIKCIKPATREKHC